VRNDLTNSDDMETPVDKSNDDSSDSTSVTSEQSDSAPPVIHNSIMVQPLPNRRQRRAFAKFAKAFVASLWPMNYKEAMSMADREKWEQAVQRELASLYKNNTWTLVP